MNLTRIILFSLVLLLHSCSQVEILRFPSSEELLNIGFLEPTKETAELFNQLTKKDQFEPFLKSEISNLNSWIKESFEYEIKLNIVKSLDSNDLALIKPILKGDKFIIELSITTEALKNPFVIVEQILHLYQITNAPLKWAKLNRSFNSYVHAYHWAEVVWNASKGSKIAEAQLARNDLEVAMANNDAFDFYNSKINNSYQNLADEYFQIRLSEVEETLNSKTKIARKQISENKKKFEERKIIFDDLEKAESKLNDLVAKNDRKGVRKLLDNYLPWELMEPSEKTSWSNWLDAIEKPNKQNTKLVFRGMYDDVVHKNSKDEVYLFSTIINKNQGNYNRRLRSLTTLRDRPFSIHYLRLKDREIPYITDGLYSASMMAMMYNHSVEAVGSPFLSTASLDVAMKFGPRQIGAFQIDERRLMPNPLPVPKYTYQHERFVPLIIFPDEIIHFHDYKEDDQGISIVKPKERKAHFVKNLEEKLGRKLSKEELSGFNSDKEFLKYGIEKMQSLFSQSSEKINTKLNCLNLLKDFL